MKAYSTLFSRLLRAYEAGHFEAVVTELLDENDDNDAKMRNVIATLCGVTLKVTDRGDFVKEIEKAIKAHRSFETPIVERVNPYACSEHCRDASGLRPCQAACPFSAIIEDRDTKAVSIDRSQCIDCGKCIDACPEGNLLDKVEFLPLKALLERGEKVIAAVAPAIVGQFGEGLSIEQLRTAFQALGFSDMVEVAFTADMLTLKEAVEFNEHVKTEKDVLITSCCCPMWIGMLKKVYYQLVKDVSPSVSPMIAAGRVIKKLNPSYKVVFIGPCVAKKPEAQQADIAGAIDFVLTFEELKEIFSAYEIDLAELNPTASAEYASREGRLYARTGGVSIAVQEAVDEMFPDKKGMLKALQANGVQECKELLKKVLNGDIEGNFIEGMGCIGGCVGGPKALISKEAGTAHVNTFAEQSDFQISLNNACMQSVLREIGINGVEDFKNKKNIEIFERKF